MSVTLTFTLIGIVIILIGITLAILNYRVSKLEVK